MPAEKIAILYNPTAGMGRALRSKLRLERLLRHFEVRYDLYVSQSVDHLRALAREQIQKRGTIVGAGGDSTFHVLINEIAAAGCGVNFGMIGIGSSNDIAREFGLHPLFEACRALHRPNVRSVDLGQISEGETPLGYFLGQANLGLGAFVNRYVADLAARHRGLAKRQTIAGILGVRKAFRSKAIPLSLDVAWESGRAREDYVSAVFSNIRYWATGKIINPQARTCDGRLDACLIAECTFPRLARISILSKSGRHVGAREVRIVQAARFELSSERPFEIQSDGEIVRAPDGRTRFHKITLSAIPKALRVLCP